MSTGPQLHHVASLAIALYPACDLLSDESFRLQVLDPDVTDTLFCLFGVAKPLAQFSQVDMKPMTMSIRPHVYHFQQAIHSC
jgi:hypothetical protein